MNLETQIQAMIDSVEDTGIKSKLEIIKTEAQSQGKLKVNLTTELNNANKKIKDIGLANGAKELEALKETYGDNADKAKILLENGLEESQIKAAFGIETKIGDTVPEVSKTNKETKEAKEQFEENQIEKEVKNRLKEKNTAAEIEELSKTMIEETK